MSERPVQQIDATDWTGYYQKPFFLSRVTRPAGVRRLIGLLKAHGVPQGGSFVELGGGNSCIYDAIDGEFAPATYAVVDQNELGLRLFRNRAGRHANVVTSQCNLLTDRVPGNGYDVVLSIGLIEHFDKSGTRIIVKKHFEAARTGGLVLITFPTPTRVYRWSRGIAEALRMWRFPDERALAVSEVVDTCRELGTVLHTSIGAWTPFTQAIVLVRKL